MANQLLTITDENFQAEVLDSALPFLLFFTAPWCGPCREVVPTLEQLVGEYAGRMVIGSLDVDNSDDIVARYNITDIPAYLLFKAGQVAAQSTDIFSKPAIENFINSNLNAE